ncbi:outer membrane protein assembly factor BamB family protein [Actinophytocola sediminis]
MTVRWRALLVGMVAVALVVMVTVQCAAPRRVSGSPRPAEGTASAPTGPHEPELVAEFAPGRFPKEYGPISVPDPVLIELRDGTGYLAYTTFEIIHLTAIDLADGEVRWTRELDLNAGLGSVSMTATDVGLLFVINFQQYAQFTILIDPETGKDLGSSSEPHLTVSGVARDQLIVYDRDQDTLNTYDLATVDASMTPKWQVAADGGRMSEIYQETEDTHRQPRDDGDLGHSVDIGSSQDENQYLVYATMYSGAISVRALTTGKVLAEGNAGEKMVDVVAYEDTVYVYRQTPRTLAAYAATDLSSPKWSVQTPAAADGSSLAMCAENLLCLTVVTTLGGGDYVLHAIDAADGRQRWQTDEYLAANPTMAGPAVAVSHRGGTVLLDPASGEVRTEFSAATFALPGDGVLIGFDDAEVQLLAPGKEPTSLGSVPDESMAAGNCEWTSEVALCASAEVYQLWRYRG